MVKPGDTHTMGAKWVWLVTKVPVLTVVLVVGVLVVMTLPARDLALGLPDNGSAPRGAPSGRRTTRSRATTVPASTRPCW